MGNSCGFLFPFHFQQPTYFNPVILPEHCLGKMIQKDTKQQQLEVIHNFHLPSKLGILQSNFY